MNLPQPSSQQEKIIKFIEEKETQKKLGENSHHCFVEAMAGSGKTTLILQIMKQMQERVKNEKNEKNNKNLQILYVAFNKNMQLEVEKKTQALGLSNNVTVKTYSSLGLSILKNKFNEQTVMKKEKMKQILSEHILTDDRDFHLFYPLEKILDYLRNESILCTMERVKKICIKYEIMLRLGKQDEPFEEYLDSTLANNQTTLYQAIEMAFQKAIEQTEWHDFSDMVFLPCALKLVSYAKKYDVIFSDEVQDINPINMELILMSLQPGNVQTQKKKGLVVMVGDVRQCIYSFRGADITAVQELMKRLQVTSFSLSETFRCPQQIVSYVRQHCKIPIEAWEHSPQGHVQKISEVSALKKLQVGDVVLCRVNAPLVLLACELLKRQIPVSLKDDGLQKRLIRHFSPTLRFQFQSIATLFQNLEQELEKLEQQRKKNQQQPDIMERLEELSALKENLQLENLKDDLSCLKAIATTLPLSAPAPKSRKRKRAGGGAGGVGVGQQPSFQNTSQEILKEKIIKIFKDTSEDYGDPNKMIYLRTVHAFKGKEADRIFIWNDEKLYESYEQEWKQIEMENIRYVAYTRARKELYLVVE